MQKLLEGPDLVAKRVLPEGPGQSKGLDLPSHRSINLLRIPFPEADPIEEPSSRRGISKEWENGSLGFSAL